MNIMSRCKVILVYMIVISLSFYCIVNDLTAYDIELIDKIETKIEKKERKDKELFFEDSIDYVPLYVICNINSKFSNLKTSYFYQKLARPPPFRTPFDSVFKSYFSEHRE